MFGAFCQDMQALALGCSRLEGGEARGGGAAREGEEAGESMSVEPGLMVILSGWLASGPAVPGRAAALPAAGSTKNLPGERLRGTPGDGVRVSEPSALSSDGRSRGCTSAASVTSGSAKSAHESTSLHLLPFQYNNNIYVEALLQPQSPRMCLIPLCLQHPALLRHKWV